MQSSNGNRVEKFDNSKKQNRALASNTKRDNKKLNKTVRGRKEVFERLKHIYQNIDKVRGRKEVFELEEAY